MTVQGNQAGEDDTLPDFVTTPELATLDRKMLGRLHPMFMGGEYLPKRKSKEVEIARISIQSTTYDVTVLYARLVGQRIHYRVVDEYDGDTLEEPSTRTSTKPLAMGAMIDFFTTAWNLMDCLEGNFDQDVEEMLGFFTARSSASKDARTGFIFCENSNVIDLQQTSKALLIALSFFKSIPARLDMFTHGKDCG